MDSGSEKIFIDKYIIDPKNKLGGGAFGEVYLGYYQPGTTFIHLSELNIFKNIKIL